MRRVPATAVRQAVFTRYKTEYSARKMRRRTTSGDVEALRQKPLIGEF